jgi:Ca2+-binding RTX toxin-like protein
MKDFVFDLQRFDFIIGTSGNDKITNSLSKVTIDGGAGNDSISNGIDYWGDIGGGSMVSINGDAGNDSIYNYYGDSCTIDGGTGNDSIYN